MFIILHRLQDNTELLINTDNLALVASIAGDHSCIWFAGRDDDSLDILESFDAINEDIRRTEKEEAERQYNANRGVFR